MYLKQKELLWELDHDFIKQLMDISTKETYEKGAFIFHQGDTADHFYVLIKGCVKLRHDQGTHPVYIANHPGEIFGWSSIVGRASYSVSAECLETSILQKTKKTDILKLIAQNKENGMIFYKKIAEMLGNRLLHLYSSSTQYEFPLSEGTGQLQEVLDA